MTQEEIKALRAGDGVVGIHTGNIAIVRSFHSVEMLPYVEYMSGPRKGEHLLMTELRWGSFRRETFIEFLTRPTGMGRTSWLQAIIIIGLGIGCILGGLLGVEELGWRIFLVVFGLVVATLPVYMGWRNYTHRTV